MTAIYLDACCLNRPFNDQSQERIRLESEAVMLILQRVQADQLHWIGSEVLTFELNQTPDIARRLKLTMLLSVITRTITLSEVEYLRGQELESLGFKDMDALHLACAESGQVTTFLTTDDRLLRLARRQADQLLVRVDNPVGWLLEEMSR